MINTTLTLPGGIKSFSFPAKQKDFKNLTSEVRKDFLTFTKFTAPDYRYLDRLIYIDLLRHRLGQKLRNRDDMPLTDDDYDDDGEEIVDEEDLEDRFQEYTHNWDAYEDSFKDFIESNEASLRRNKLTAIGSDSESQRSLYLINEIIKIVMNVTDKDTLEKEKAHETNQSQK